MNVKLLPTLYLKGVSLTPLLSVSVDSATLLIKATSDLLRCSISTISLFLLTLSSKEANPFLALV